MPDGKRDAAPSKGGTHVRTANRASRRRLTVALVVIGVAISALGVALRVLVPRSDVWIVDFAILAMLQVGLVAVVAPLVVAALNRNRRTDSSD